MLEAEDRILMRKMICNRLCGNKVIEKQKIG